MRFLTLAILAATLFSPLAQAGALYRMETKFTSMNETEVVVRNKNGKRIRLQRDLLSKSDIELLAKKSNGKFVTISVLSRAIINEKGIQ